MPSSWHSAPRADALRETPLRLRPRVHRPPRTLTSLKIFHQQINTLSRNAQTKAFKKHLNFNVMQIKPVNALGDGDGCLMHIQTDEERATRELACAANPGAGATFRHWHGGVPVPPHAAVVRVWRCRIEDTQPDTDQVEKPCDAYRIWRRAICICGGRKLYSAGSCLTSASRPRPRGGGCHPPPRWVPHSGVVQCRRWTTRK